MAGSSAGRCANELTRHALDQSNSVPTSTFETAIAGTDDGKVMTGHCEFLD
jgi:hypothetical protein